MRTIFKYPVPITDEFTVRMPEHGQVLKVEEQGGNSFMWVEVNTDRPEVEYRFAVVGTGNPVPGQEPDSNLYVEHVDTWQAPPFVWHLYRLWDIESGSE